VPSTIPTPANLVHIVLEGGFPPGHRGQTRARTACRRFATVLSNDEVAQLLTHIRGSWGNEAGGGIGVRRHEVPCFQRALNGDPVRGVRAGQKSNISGAGDAKLSI